MHPARASRPVRAAYQSTAPVFCRGVRIAVPAGAAVIVLAGVASALRDGRPLFPGGQEGWGLASLTGVMAGYQVALGRDRWFGATGAGAALTLAVLLLYGWLPGALVSLALITLTGLVRRGRRGAALTHGACDLLGIGAAALALAAMGTVPTVAGPWDPDEWRLDVLPAFLLAVGVYLVVSRLLLWGCLAPPGVQPSLARSVLSRQLLVVTALCALAPLIGAVAIHVPVMLPLFAIPLIALDSMLWIARARARDQLLDPLTGLPNRRWLLERIRTALRDAERGGHRCALILIDLDRFRSVNDTLGHLTGDRLLLQIADRVRAALPRGAETARLGGDEFAVLLPEVASVARARGIAARVLGSFGAPLRLDGVTLVVEASAGVAVFPDHTPAGPEHTGVGPEHTPAGPAGPPAGPSASPSTGPLAAGPEGPTAGDEPDPAAPPSPGGGVPRPARRPARSARPAGRRAGRIIRLPAAPYSPAGRLARSSGDQDPLDDPPATDLPDGAEHTHRADRADRGGSAGTAAAAGRAGGQEAEALLRRADVAMYEAKHGQAGVAVYDVSRDGNTPDRLGLLGDLRHALDTGQLDLHYQPKVSFDGTVAGVEALLRWEHPSRGRVSPGEFITIAETSGLMPRLTEYVLEAALAQVASWRAAGITVPVAVNVSPRDIHTPGFVGKVAAQLARHGVPAGALQLEITEHVMLEDPRQAADTLAELTGHGVRMSLDDFGTGYSSLVHLRRLPVSELKIDRSFVARLTRDAEDAEIVRCTIDLAHSLGLFVVAEGVEDDTTRDRLRELGCDAIQGWLVAGALPACRATAWLRERTRAASDGAPAATPGTTGPGTPPGDPTALPAGNGGPRAGAGHSNGAGGLPSGAVARAGGPPPAPPAAEQIPGPATGGTRRPR